MTAKQQQLSHSRSRGHRASQETGKKAAAGDAGSSGGESKKGQKKAKAKAPKVR